MPYRLNPRNRLQVQVKRGIRWAILKTHKTPAAARAHLAALKINVEGKKGHNK